jgi:hypothetical protein
LKPFGGLMLGAARQAEMSWDQLSFAQFGTTRGTSVLGLFTHLVGGT